MERAYLVTTDYSEPGEIQGFGSQHLSDGSYDDFARANAGHFRRHSLEPGCLYYFDAEHVHTWSTRARPSG